MVRPGRAAPAICANVRCPRRGPRRLRDDNHIGLLLKDTANAPFECRRISADFIARLGFDMVCESFFACCWMRRRSKIPIGQSVKCARPVLATLSTTTLAVAIPRNIRPPAAMIQRAGVGQVKSHPAPPARWHNKACGQNAANSTWPCGNAAVLQFHLRAPAS